MIDSLLIAAPIICGGSVCGGSVLGPYFVIQYSTMCPSSFASFVLLILTGK